MLKYLITIFILLCASMAAFAAQQRSLVKGEADTVRSDFVIGEVAMADSSICDYMVNENRREIYLNPKKEGRTTLTFWNEDGSKREQVQISVSSGEKQADATMDSVAGEIERAIATPGIRVRVMNGRLVMEGTAYSQEDLARAEKVAQLFDGDVANLVKLKDVRRNTSKEQLIQLDMHFMEVKRSALRTFGVNWSPGSMPAGGASNISGGGGEGLLPGVSGLGQSLIGFVLNLAPKIKFARQRGEARVLENPAFLVKSGESAEFFSGTQVPYYSQQAVVFKEVGIKVTAEPISSADDVDLKITVNVSTPTAGGINRGIDTSTVSTTAYCRAGSSLALAGIFKNSDAKMINRVPEDINTSSALFSLFLSKDFVSNRSEFVIFVTPRIIAGDNAAANPTSLDLSDWSAIDRDITKKRSKKETPNNGHDGFEVPESLK